MSGWIGRVFSRDAISTDAGLLALRLIVGTFMFLLHGLGKLQGGPELWEKVGGAMGNLGLGFAPTFWGFMAAISESVCALLLVLGLATRPAAALLGFTMLVAGAHHLSLPPDNPGSGWNAASHAFELMAVCVCLLLTGPGRYSVPWPARKG